MWKYNDSLFDKMVSNIKEVKARGAVVMGLVTNADASPNETKTKGVFLQGSRFYYVNDVVFEGETPITVYKNRTVGPARFIGRAYLNWMTIKSLKKLKLLRIQN